MDFDATGPDPEPAIARSRSDGQASRQRYEIPMDLTPPQRFEHWRAWYGQAVDTPVRLEATGPVSSLFCPSAVSFTGPGFSLIELRNEPASGSWNANPDLDDLRLAYFVKAESATYNFSGQPTPLSAPRVHFLDLTRDGSFHAPCGMHVIQLNLDRAGLGVDAAAAKRLAAVPNLIQHPVLRSLVMPVLLGCRNESMGAHAGAAATALRSVTTALISSLLDVPAEPEALQPSRRLEIKKHIHRNYASRDLAVEAIAQRFHMSRRALFCLFEREELGVGARIRALRTARALELLLDKEWQLRPIDELAARSGFSNTQSLRRALKETTGLTARDLRENPAVIAGYLEGLRRSLGR